VTWKGPNWMLKNRTYSNERFKAQRLEIVSRFLATPGLNIAAYVAAFLALSIVGWLQLRHQGLLDDAYITARYASNIAHGYGWVWNAGEPPTNGTTTPLWTLTLAAVLRLHLALLPTALLLNAICYALAGIFGCVISSRFGGRIGFTVCLLWTFVLSSTLPAAAGMETPLYAMVVMGAFLAWVCRYEKTAILIAGVLPLVRGDGSLLLLILVLLTIREKRLKQMGPWIALAFLPVAAWEMFSWWQFHSLLPSSFLAKHAQVANVGGKVSPSTFLLAVWPTAWLLIISTFLIRPVGRSVSSVNMLRAWCLVYFIFYCAVANVPEQGWYVLPFWWTIPVIVASGFNWVPIVAGRARSAARLAVIAACTFIGLWTGLAHVRAGIAAPQAALSGDRSAADFLSTQPPGLIASPEVGNLGYYSGHPVIDMLGLVSPEVIPHLGSKDYVWILQKDRPRYVFTWTLPARQKCSYEFTCVLWENAWFLQHYREIWKWNGSSSPYGVLEYH
jgi:arabinofuranosyltransferase